MRETNWTPQRLRNSGTGTPRFFQKSHFFHFWAFFYYRLNFGKGYLFLFQCSTHFQGATCQFCHSCVCLCETPTPDPPRPALPRGGEIWASAGLRQGSDRASAGLRQGSTGLDRASTAPPTLTPRLTTPTRSSHQYIHTRRCLLSVRPTFLRPKWKGSALATTFF